MLSTDRQLWRRGLGRPMMQNSTPSVRDLNPPFVDFRSNARLGQLDCVSIGPPCGPARKSEERHCCLLDVETIDVDR